jgi:eukaryotic-like serine/threonine-protein kinase
MEKQPGNHDQDNELTKEPDVKPGDCEIVRNSDKLTMNSNDSELSGQFHSLDQFFRMVLSESVAQESISTFSSLQFHQNDPSTGQEPHTDIQSISSVAPVDQFGPFLILHYIGHGGFGIVYQALDLRNNKTVALKILRKDRLGNLKIRKHFLYQSYISSQLSHNYIVKCLDHGIINDIPYLALELIDGLTLDQLIRKTHVRMQVKTVIEIVWAIATAIESAHERNLIHGDIKPGNVLVEFHKMDSYTKIVQGVWPFQKIKLFDFAVGFASDIQSRQWKKKNKSVATRIYAAPEQNLLSDYPVDHRTDIFGLGMLLFHLIKNSCINPAIPQQPTVSGIDSLVHDLLQNNAQGFYPDRISDLLMQSLQPVPDDRFQNVASFKTALADCLKNLQ